MKFDIVQPISPDNELLKREEIENKIKESKSFDSKLELQCYLIEKKIKSSTMFEYIDYIILMHLTLMKNMDMIIEEGGDSEIRSQAKLVLEDMKEELKELTNEKEIEAYNQCMYILNYYINYLKK